jgi:hypothetical protein
MWCGTLSRQFVGSGIVGLWSAAAAAVEAEEKGKREEARAVGLSFG